MSNRVSQVSDVGVSPNAAIQGEGAKQDAEAVRRGGLGATIPVLLMLTGIGLFGYAAWGWLFPLERRIELELAESGPIVELEGDRFIKYSGTLKNRSSRPIRCLGALPC